MQSYLVGILHIALLAGIGLVISAAYAQVTLDARDDFVYRPISNATELSYLIDVLENDDAPEGTTIMHVTAIVGTNLETNTIETFPLGDIDVQIIDSTRLEYDVPHLYRNSDYKFTFNYTITAGTNSDTATVTVTNVEPKGPNEPPVLDDIPNFEIYELSEETRSIAATDETLPNGDLVWTTSPNRPEGINITSTDSTTAVLRWTPTEQQGPKSHTFNITVSDGEFTDTQELTIMVNETNQDPIITDPGSQIAYVGEQFRLPLNVRDDDWPAQSLSYIFMKMDSSRSATDDTGAKIDSSGVITWTPTVDDIENHTVTVIVTDDFGKVSDAKNGSDRIDIDIEVQSRNPSFVHKEISFAQNAHEGRLFSYAPNITDSDTPEGPFTIQITDGQTGNAAINSTNYFVWTPGEEHGGDTHSFELTVTDPDNRTGTDTLHVKVTETNQIPIITDPGPQTAYVGHEFELDVNVTDNDDIGATLNSDYYPEFGFNYEDQTLQQIDVPTGARINDETGVITWTPTASHKPSQTWTVEYSDDFTSLAMLRNLYANETSGTDQIVINVDVVDSPSFGTMEVQMIEEDQTLRYTLPLLHEPGTRFADLNIAIAESDRRGNATITKNETHADFVWTPDEEDGDDTHMFALNVTDADGNSGNATLSVNVTETNQIPVFNDINTSLTHSINTMFHLDLNATDDDLPEQTISYEILSHDGPSGTAPTINGTTGEIAWNLTEIGQHTLRVRASDDYNPPGRNDTTITIRATFDDMENPVITLREADQNPQIIELGDGYMDLGADVTDDDPAYTTRTATATPATIDTTIAANHTVTYTAPADASGKKPVNVTRIVRVQDTKAPIITIGIPVQTIDIGSNYTDRNATVTDNDPAYTTRTVTGTPATIDTATAANHTVTYTAPADAAGNVPDPVTRTVEVKDLTVPNILPEAPDDMLEVNEGETETIMPAIADEDGTPTITDVGSASKGTPRVVNATTIEYSANDNEDGPDSFTYTVTDNRDGTKTGTISVSIIGINDPPVLRTVPDSPTIPELELYEFNLTATDEDDDNSTLIFGHAGAPEGLDIDGNLLSWTPTEEQGRDNDYTFNITVSDDEGATDSQEVTFTVTEVNTAPVLDPLLDEYAAPPGTELVIDVNANDTDIPEQMLRYEISSARPIGMEINTTDGTITWMPTAEQAGRNYTITVMVEDDARGSDTTTFTVTVRAQVTGGPNQDPVAPDVQSNARLNALTRITPDITDPDGNNVRITKITGEMRGTVDQASLASGTILYRPNQTGIERLTYEVEDSMGGTASGMINIYINERRNARPALAGIDDTGTTVGTNVNFTANAMDANDDPLTFDIANAPEGATINATTGIFSWTPTPSQNGTHVVTIIVHDDRGGASWQDVTITVLRAGEINRPPIPEDITTTAVIGEPKTFQPRIMDPDGDTVTMTLESPALRGTILDAFVSRGILIYIGTGLGQEEFTYTLSDGRGGTATGTIILEVLPPANISPILGLIGDRNINALRELAFNADARDIDSTMLTFGLIGEPAGAQITPQGAFSWTPTEAQEGRHNFTVIVSDDAGGNDTETITVNVRDKDFVNSPPIAPDIVDSTPQNTPGIIRPPISDPNDDPVRITTATGNTKGEIITGFLRAGIVIYRPNPGQTGIDTITYTVSDGSTQTSTGAITVFINAGGNRNPVLTPIGFRNINAGEQLTFNIMARDRDPISYLLAGAPAEARISEQGAFSWTPAPADVGNHTFTIAVYDERGGSSSEAVTVRVLPAGTPNGAPNAPSFTLNVTAGSSVNIMPDIGDPDGDQVNITGNTNPAKGFTIPSGDGILYFSNAGESGTDMITYIVTDARGAMATGTIIITITTIPN